MKIKISILFLLIGIWACGPEPVYDETIAIETEHWIYENQLDFEMEILDTTQVSELQLIIDHSVDYSFENIYLKVNTQFPDGKKQDERLSIDLADKTGKWIGKCLSENCKLKVYLLEKFKFPEQGVYHFVFEQHSRQDSLRGINALQLKVIPVKE